MIDNYALGNLNGHAVGIIMKELVRRAITAIRNQKQAFEVHVKQGYSGKMDDMLTSADQAAQGVYIRSLRECFPGWGIIAEEDNLAEACTDGSGFCFTVDPLDGTKAYVRRQSHGVGTMISLFKGNEYVAAYVGDVNTQEIYGFRPESDNVHRISEFNTNETLSALRATLSDQYVLLRDPERLYTKSTELFIKSTFRNVLVDGGSIGTWLARLWKGEVGAALLPPSFETPWDSNPVNAISIKMGFRYFRPHRKNKWQRFYPEPITEKFKRNYEVLIVHESNMGDLTDV